MSPQLMSVIVVEHPFLASRRIRLMTTQTAAVPTTHPDQKVPLPLKLSAAWISFMCLYIYVDVLGFYKPGAVEGILAGKVHTFDISQGFFVIALAASAVPTMMILLSATLPAGANRSANLAVAALLIPWMSFNLAGGEWPFYYGLGLALELVILAWILRSAWTWPRTRAIPSLKM